MADPCNLLPHIAGIMNPDASQDVKDYLIVVKQKQARAGVIPKQVIKDKKNLSLYI